MRTLLEDTLKENVAAVAVHVQFNKGGGGAFRELRTQP